MSIKHKTYTALQAKLQLGSWASCWYFYLTLHLYLCVSICLAQTVVDAADHEIESDTKIDLVLLKTPLHVHPAVKFLGLGSQWKIYIINVDEHLQVD